MPHAKSLKTMIHRRLEPARTKNQVQRWHKLIDNLSGEHNEECMTRRSKEDTPGRLSPHRSDTVLHRPPQVLSATPASFPMSANTTNLVNVLPSTNNARATVRNFTSTMVSSLSSLSSSPPSTSARLARLMHPSDANIAGNVHGGTIMKLMEEAAGVAGSRYFNNNEKKNKSDNSNKMICALTSRVEQMTFQCPVHVGDVAKVHAEVVFASQRTIAISVQVTAERMAWSHDTTNRRNKKDNETSTNKNNEDVVCNIALMWLVGVELPDDYHLYHVSVHKINPKDYKRADAPSLPIPNKDHDPFRWYTYQRAAIAYNDRIEGTSMKSIADKDIHTIDVDGNVKTDGGGPIATGSSPADASSHCFTPDYSAVELVQVMLPSDCTTNTGLVGGGVVMKLMDNACGVVAARHCGSNVVTVAVDSVDLISPVLVGDVLKVKARPTFTSSKSLEIEVSAIAERFSRQETQADDSDSSNGDDIAENRERSTKAKAMLVRHDVVTTQRAYFTFVSLPLDDTTTTSTLPMRPLTITNKEDRRRFEAGKARYEQRKLNRLSHLSRL